MKSKVIIGAIATALTMSASAAPALAAECGLSNAVYKDVDGQGFRLEFSGRTATLSRQRQPRIMEFNVTQSQGYGTVYLLEKGNQDSSFGVYSFGSNLKKSPALLGRGKAPTYVFVAGLGSAVYYRDRSLLLGDTLWKFEACR